jgi:hypothetical protein
MSSSIPDARIGGSFASALGISDRFGGMNIPEMILAIQVERGQILDNQIKDQMEEMQKRNEWLRDANAALGAMRAQRPTSEGGGAISYGTFVDSKGTTQNVHDWMRANGVQIETKGNDKVGVQAEFDQAIQNLKSSIDTVNNQSQMDMVRLQGLMDKRNQAFDMMTNTISKTSKSLDGIIGNMR